MSAFFFSTNGSCFNDSQLMRVLINTKTKIRGPHELAIWGTGFVFVCIYSSHHQPGSLFGQKMVLINFPTKMIERLIQIGAIGCSNFYMSIMNSHKIHNIEALRQVLANRPPGVPLITYSNHTCVLDDPLILALLTPSIFSTGKNLRYTLGAEEVCLGGSFLHRWLFIKAGRVIPIRRGEGPFQPAMDQAIRLLNQGNWLHVFVEGKVYPDSSTLHTPIRHGIARLILECRPKPWILPIVHTGMEHIKPYGAYIPSLLKQVDIYIGKMIDGGDMVNKLPPYADPVLYFAITRYLERKLQKTYPSSSEDLLDE